MHKARVFVALIAVAIVSWLGFQALSAAQHIAKAHADVIIGVRS